MKSQESLNFLSRNRSIIICYIYSNTKDHFPHILADIYLGSFLESVTTVHGKYQTGICRTGAVKDQHTGDWIPVFCQGLLMLLSEVKPWVDCRSIHTLVTKGILELEFKTILKVSVTSREHLQIWLRKTFNSWVLYSLGNTGRWAFSWLIEKGSAAAHCHHSDT